MNSAGRHEEVAEAVRAITSPDYRGSVIVGPVGSGKTSLVSLIVHELDTLGIETYLFAGAKGSRRDISSQILDMLSSTTAFRGYLGGQSRIIRSSSGHVSVRELVELMQKVPGRPVLILDIGAEPYFERQVNVLREIVENTPGWKYLITASSGSEVRRLDGFLPVDLGRRIRAGEQDYPWLLAASLLGKDAAEFMENACHGNPELAETIVAELLIRDNYFQRHGFGNAVGVGDLDDKFRAYLLNIVESAIADSFDPDTAGLLIDELALSGGGDPVSALALNSNVPVERALSVLGSKSMRRCISVDSTTRNYNFVDERFREVVLRQRIMVRAYRLNSLRFGAEEAERDDTLGETFVESQDVAAIVAGRKTLIVGDRGSGKSALFRVLADRAVDSDRMVGISLLRMGNPGDLLHKVVAADAWLDTERLRAAWLAIIAATYAEVVPHGSKNALGHRADRLRTALGLSTQHLTRWKRAVGVIARLFKGTALKLSFGPVNLEAKLPIGESTVAGRTPIDLESFLADLNCYLRTASMRAVVMLDRVDEVFKYERSKQEAIVQALLQAESHISLHSNLDMIVFLRTDLFELYDIQEKNKLVSRRLELRWSDDQWLEVLVRRVLSNRSLRHLAERLTTPTGVLDARKAINVIFPVEIENVATDQWLLRSLRNGNGDISPRLAVLLLHLARDASPERDESTGFLPVLSGEALGIAMTQVSDAAFNELITDFKVATTFVLNCRAGKLREFALDEVNNLFGEEGIVGDQVRLLEKLGFLERIVRQTGKEAKTTFRIPELYTRCWDYA